MSDGGWDRSVSYWLMTAVFAVVALVETRIAGGSDGVNLAIPLSVGGLLGLITGQRWVMAGRLIKSYDILFGIVFSLVGVLGLLAPLYVSLVPSQFTVIPRTPLTTFIEAVYAYVGLAAFIRGVQRKP